MDPATTGAINPPPRPAGTVGGPVPQETRNTIVRPVESTGPNTQFSLSEGKYSLRDEVTLGPVAPHPSETNPIPQSILDTKIPVPTAGVMLSIAVLAPRRPTSFRRRSHNAPSFKSSFPSSSADSSHDSSKHSSDHGSRNGGFGGQTSKSRFGESNPILNPPNVKEPKDSLKRKKPKNGITKSSSSFVSRALPHESLSKRLQDHKEEGAYAFANTGRAMLWLDLSSVTKQEQLIKILFTKAHALCHDFNDYSKTPAHLDLIMGFNTSELIWYEAMSQKYTRLNKNGLITSSPVSCIKWLPGSENLFITAQFDGTLAVYDKDKDDAPFVPEDGSNAVRLTTSAGKRLPRLVVKKSVQSKNQKTNPVAFWKATGQRINGMEFSPDGKYLALACEDGSLRILDFLNEELIDLYRSYYGGFTCVCWSPDSTYLLTGGQDDLISIWSVEDKALLARCVGHRSWVSCMAFDPWRCDETTYRFGSVGEDGRLLLWDFSVGMLNQPRSASIRQSVSSAAPQRHDSEATIRRLPSSPSALERTREPDEDNITYPVLPRAAVAMLPPVMSREVDPHALSFLRFEADCIIVACQLGHIRTWDRPGASNGQSNGSTV